MARPSQHVVVGLAVALVAVVLGLLNGRRSFDYDEAITYSNFINGGSPRRALTTQVVFNNHPMFSLLEALLWRVGLVSEAAQRLLPVGCGGASIGLIAAYTTRRSNVVGGVTAGAVLLCNPMYFQLFRSLRGYSLAVFGIVVAGIAIQQSWHDPRRRWLVVQAVAMTVAVTTHAYSAVFIVTFAVATLALGHLRVHHVATWSMAAAIATLITLPILDDVRAASAGRGNRYVPGFGEFTLREVLGRATPVVVIVGVLTLVGAVTLARRSWRHAVALAAGAAVPTVVFLFVWQVAQPFDLYSRFFVGLVPFVAVLAGFGIGRLPQMVSAAIPVVIVLALIPTLSDLIDREAGTREAGAIVDQAREIGKQVCGYSAEAIWVYTPQISFADLDRLGDCDVVVNGLRLRGEPLERISARFPEQLVVDGSIGVWSDSATIDQLRRWTNGE